MADYWKSTPRYWCKHCGVYVRDTGLEKSNHEATSKHQSNLARFLRNIHRDSELEKTAKQRAKDEVARLNGTLSDGNAQVDAKVSPANKGISRQATADDRKAQMAQLASMGVAIPEAYRQDMAIAGDWQAVAKKPGVTSSQESSSFRAGSKRKDRADETGDALEPKKRQPWGSVTKTVNKTDQSTTELETLLDRITEDKLLKVEASSSSVGDTLGAPHSTEKAVSQSSDVKPDLKSLKSDTMRGEEEEEIVFKKRRTKATKK